MANLRDIKRRINSVRSTMQITRTMEMVSTAKIRRALDRAEKAAPYKEALTNMLAHVSGSADAVADQPLLAVRKDEKRVLFVLVASDRGLAGGFNVIPQRAVAARIAELNARGVECELITCGRKPTEYFKYRDMAPVMSFEGISADPTVDQADRIAAYIMSSYAAGSIDRVMLYYHHAKNRVEQVQVVEQVLPLDQDALKIPTAPRAAREAMQPIEPVDPHTTAAPYEFEPSATEVLSYLLPVYVRTIIYHALLDSAAAEHAARRAAMQSATESAQEVITELSRTYNRERQGSITTELNEIIAGASALEDN